MFLVRTEDIQVKANNFVVDQDGKIFENAVYRDQEGRLVSKEENQWEETEQVDRLKVVDFKRGRYIQRQGGSLYRTTAESGDARIMEGTARPKVRQGFLEGSNVNPVVEMVRMIEVNRAYEANQKAIQTDDNLAGKQINETIRV